MTLPLQPIYPQAVTTMGANEENENGISGVLLSEARSDAARVKSAQTVVLAAAFSFTAFIYV